MDESKTFSSVIHFRKENLKIRIKEVDQYIEVGVFQLWVFNYVAKIMTAKPDPTQRRREATNIATDHWSNGSSLYSGMSGPFPTAIDALVFKTSGICIYLLVLGIDLHLSALFACKLEG